MKLNCYMIGALNLYIVEHIITSILYIPTIFSMLIPFTNEKLLKKSLQMEQVAANLKPKSLQS